MSEIFKLLAGIFVLILGFPMGMLLAKFTSDELKAGKFWFRIIIFAGFFGAIASLFLRNDIFLFAFLFISIITGMCLKFRR